MIQRQAAELIDGEQDVACHLPDRLQGLKRHKLRGDIFRLYFAFVSHFIYYQSPNLTAQVCFACAVSRPDCSAVINL